MTRLAAIWDAGTHVLAEDDPWLHSLLREVLDHHMPILVGAERGAFRLWAHGHKPVKQLDAVEPDSGGKNATRHP
ncbi:hypothetical protein [Plantibacter sp. RU18]|uniref:hypothetical protein n=1 Tax=Plantibacter sp. RU18 TaxID=3158143 RepID=UPI003D36F421